jgi:hypothetical protein
VVGISGTMNSWGDPAGATLAKYNAGKSTVTDPLSKAGTYVYNIAGLTFAAGAEFKFRSNGGWLGFGEIEISGVTAAGEQGGNISGVDGCYDIEITLEWDGEKATSIKAAFAVGTPSEVEYKDITVSGLVPEGWTQCFIWAWNDEGIYTGGTWPGEELTITNNKVSKTFYHVPVPINVIFSNGSGMQTVDITGITEDIEIDISPRLKMPSAAPNRIATIAEDNNIGNSNLTSVIIPNSVTSIGDYAFYGCSSLSSITIPNSVTSIGYFAFYDCSSLTSPVYNAHMFAFMPTSYSGEYSIPDGIESIASGAFCYCSSLTSITIPKSIISIGERAFFGCTSLSSVVWNVKNYNYYYYGMPVFYDASYDMRPQITSFIFGQDVEHIPAYICNGMTNLKTLSITGTNVKSIGPYAFQNVNSRNFRTITLPSVQTIGSYAFSGCSYLESIDFGSRLENIGAYAFQGCTRVASMIRLADITPGVEQDGLTSISEQAELYVLKNCVQKYKVDANWNRFIIKEMTAESTNVTDITIVPEENTATISWPQVNGAATYELVIKDKAGNIICTLVFNSNGQLTSIVFHAPAQGNASQQTQASGFSFTVTGLDSGTAYDLTLTAKNASGSTIQTKTITFATNGLEPIDNIQSDKAQSTKVLRNGQLFIERNGHIYDAKGQEVR